MLITFEGIDGSGKTTLIKEVYKRLRKEKVDVIKTKEPAGTKVGKKITKIIMNDEIARQTEALLFAASRREHVRQVIMPAVAFGKMVLCDRFVHSSVAYQGAGNKLGEKRILDLNREFAMLGAEPRLVFILDISVEESIRRIQERGKTNEFDKKDLLFYHTARESFLKMAMDPMNPFTEIVVLNGRLTTNELTEIVINKIKEVYF